MEDLDPTTRVFLMPCLKKEILQVTSASNNDLIQFGFVVFFLQVDHMLSFSAASVVEISGQRAYQNLLLAHSSIQDWFTLVESGVLQLLWDEDEDSHCT